MIDMVYEVCKHINNFFALNEKRIDGKFTCAAGNIDNLPIASGQYFLIEGSVFNDGVHQYPCNSLTSEEFTGSITPMAVPKSFLTLVGEIGDYNAKCSSVGVYESESFGGYSYSLARNSAGGVVSWMEQYKTRLNAWRKM